jgi:hypothetical protein
VEEEEEEEKEDKWRWRELNLSHRACWSLRSIRRRQGCGTGLPPQALGSQHNHKEKEEIEETKLN